MKWTNVVRPLVAALALVPAVGFGQAWTATGSVALEGDSTLHKYRAEAKGVTARARVETAEGEDLGTALRGGGLKALEVRIPVTKLSSGKKDLDKNMQQALEAKSHPEIGFKLQSYEAEPGAGGAVKMKAKGLLTVAGVQKPVTLDLVATKAGEGMRFTGTRLLRMTDFGITPPVMMLGTLKTADEVNISFDLQLHDPRAKAVPPGA